MFKWWMTPFLYDAANDDGAGGGAAPPGDELPEHLRDRYVAKTVHDGTVGSYKQQRDRARAEADRLAGEKKALEDQLKEITSQLDGLKERAASVDTLTQKASELEGSLKSAQALNARLRTLMQFPALLDESTLALVEASNLEGEALETLLGKMAEKFSSNAGAQHNDPSGATPPRPKSTEVKPEDLMAEAEQARREGKFDLFNHKMQEAWALMDAINPFQPPRISEPN